MRFDILKMTFLQARLGKLFILLLGFNLAFAIGTGISQKAIAASPAQVSASQTGQSMGITAIQYNNKSNAIQIVTNRNFPASMARNYTLMKLPNPFRLVMDIPEANLLLPKNIAAQAGTRVDIGKDGIESIELAETQTKFYKAVRVTVYVDKAKTLWKLNANVQDNVLALGSVMPIVIKQSGKDIKTLAGNPVPTLPVAAAPATNPTTAIPSPQAPPSPATITPPANAQGSDVLVTAGHEIIESIDFKGDQLEVRSAKGSMVRVKNRFSLSAPNRLVIDLDNAVVATKSMIKTLYPPENASDIRQVRIGQFDDETVRLVIETSDPERVLSVYPGSDKRLLTVGMVADASVAQLPADTVLGQMKNIVVGKRDGETVVRVSADAEIVHRMTRSGDKIILELLNIASRQGGVPFESDSFKEFDDVRTEPLTSGQSNSKIVVDLKQSNLDVNVELASDNKTLDLVFVPLTHHSGGSVARAPYSAKIVIDAGHGGKDMGANRNGVLEKDLNLQVVMLLKKELEKRGLQVQMTRSSDVFLPLPQITKIANDARPDLFVSVHQNASTNPGLNGIETYYYTAQSLPLAKKVHARMVNNVSAPDRGVRKAMFYVIHHTNVPAILCEVGYISNTSERAELQSWERQQRTAAAIADGVVDFLKSKVSAQAR
ncbi:MAG: N-acetylmuramoyl-L-alanine amidase [Vampirovibrionales bacterium]|nr:N-acetylmuramoyl-L-alanine amidase [Vampirovibrionales bacterium]